jgi:Flp pilus assembly protein TadD
MLIPATMDSMVSVLFATKGSVGCLAPPQLLVQVRNRVPMACVSHRVVLVLKQSLLPVYGTVAYPNEKLLRAYADNKQYNRVIEIWQGQVMNNPTDARVRSALAGAYYQAGRRGDALQELYKARDLEKDPTQRAQLEGAIKELLSGK